MAFATPVALISRPNPQLLLHHSLPRINVSNKRRVRMTASTPPTTQTERPSPPKFDFLSAWYPVAWTADVLPLRPISVQILTRNYVVYYDRPNQKYIVLDDICPHRCAPLSEGRIYERNDNTETILECGYHGWRFDTCGTCVDIPVVPQSKPIPKAANVKGVYPTAVHLGLIFAWLGEPNLADEALIPIPKKVLDAPPEELTLTRTMKRTFPVPFSGVLENLADPAHVPFAHHGTAEGSRERVYRQMKMEVVKRDKEKGDLESAVFAEGVPQSLYNISFQAPTAVSYDVHVSAPGQKVGKLFMLLTWTVPRNAQSCDLFVTYAHQRGRFYKWRVSLVPRWVQHIRGNMVLDGDAAIIGGVEKALSTEKWQKRYVLASGSWDALVVELRRWLDEYAPYWIRARGGEVDKKVLIDRLRWHVNECVSCRVALQNLKRARVGVWVAVGICVAAGLFGGILFAVCTKEGIAFSASRLKLIVFGASLLSILFVIAGAVVERLIRLMTFTDVAERARLAA